VIPAPAVREGEKSWPAPTAAVRIGARPGCLLRRLGTPDAGTITSLLNAADAADALYSLVKDDLQRIARRRKRVTGTEANPDASTTGLVDDAFCRLVGRDATTWQPGDRCKFFSYMSRKIQGDLIDLIRRAETQKRGNGAAPEELDEDRVPVDGPDLLALIDLQAALDKLEQFDPDAAMVVRCRHFLDCTFEEAAGLIGRSKTEAVRTHQRAMMWLKRELKEYGRDP
jgi:RNA polymerase sigma factor (TIGR02999 family)